MFQAIEAPDPNIFCGIGVNLARDIDPATSKANADRWSSPSATLSKVPRNFSD